MKKLLFFLLLFAGPVFAQTTPLPSQFPLPNIGGVQGYVTIGATQQVKPVTFVVVAPGVYAVPSATIGAAEYQTCMAGTAAGSSTVMTCQMTYSQTVQKDINDRFQTVIRAFYQGLPAGITADQILSQNQIYIQSQ